MREKLIDLLITAQDLITLSRKADFLIANDVVPVVRCKDCEYRSQYHDENGFYKCGGIQTDDGALVLMVKPDQFCSRGERRTHDNT